MFGADLAMDRRFLTMNAFEPCFLDGLRTDALKFYGGSPGFEASIWAVADWAFK